MEIGMYEKEVEDKEIREIAERILPDTSFGKIYRICEQYGEEEADCREYDVYKLVTPEGDRMLKKADKREVSNYGRPEARNPGWLRGRGQSGPPCGSHICRAG